MQLSDVQQQAVEYIDSPLIVSAGAGSGKTRVLTHKFAYLVSQLGYNPNNILCVTFTNKAANELKERVRLLSNISPGSCPWIRTIHSACLNMMKPFLDLIGYNSNFTIFTSYEQKKLLRGVLKNNDIDSKRLWDISAAISKLKNAPMKEALDSYDGDKKELQELFNQYNYALRYNNAFDFDDLLRYVLHLLTEYTHVREYYQNLFAYILIDEFQDVNHIQNEIVKLLVNDQPKITVVGDDYQAIYSFRLANPQFFINFEKSFTTSKLTKLEQNYRSAKNIVEISDHLIKNNPDQIDKDCFSKIDVVKKPSIVRFQTADEEAFNIALACNEYVKRMKMKYSDIAILYRVKSMSRSVEQQLLKLNVPYKIVGNVSFFERLEIKDIMSYLTFVNNPSNQVAFERLSQAPKRGIGKKVLEDVLASTGNNVLEKISYYLQVGKGSRTAKAALRKILEFCNSANQLSDPFTVVDNVLDYFDFDNYLEKVSATAEENEDRKNNVEELLDMSKKFTSISDFIEEMSLLNNPNDVDDNKVNLMTIHAAKGLEFKAVFVMGLEEQSLPHGLALKADKEEMTRKHLEEERRLFYVAMTRAEQVLNITHCEKRHYHLKPSRFLREIDKFCSIKKFDTPLK